MSEDAEIKGVIPNYYSLIIDKLNRIYEAWDENNYYLALIRSMRLITFLPRKLKKVLNPEKQRINQKLIHGQRIKGYNRTNTKELILWNTSQTAQEELEPFIDKITTVLDEEHLLTQTYGIPTKAKTMKDFQLTVDEAKYGVKT